MVLSVTDSGAVYPITKDTVLRHHTCEMYEVCGYSTDSMNENTLAAHLRRVHGRSSRGYADLLEFIAEGFIVEADHSDYVISE